MMLITSKLEGTEAKNGLKNKIAKLRQKRDEIMPQWWKDASKL
jgi:hypothetical protein